MPFRRHTTIGTLRANGCDEKERVTKKSALSAGMALALAQACLLDPPGVRVELTRAPVTLSGEPRVLAAASPLPAESAVLGVCVFPGPGHYVTGRWTVRTPQGREASLVARAELLNGDVVKLAAPSSGGASLCVGPRRGGPLEAPVRRLHLVASTKIVAARIEWRAGAS
jgi:hypothetical protein